MEDKYIILMVEDEPSVMDVNRRMLKRRGYDLKEAKNAREAYQFLEHTIPDLFILDILLPDGNGYDICRYFRNKSTNPVIFLTACTGGDHPGYGSPAVRLCVSRKPARCKPCPSASLASGRSADGHGHGIHLGNLAGR